MHHVIGAWHTSCAPSPHEGFGLVGYRILGFSWVKLLFASAIPGFIRPTLFLNMASTLTVTLKKTLDAQLSPYSSFFNCLAPIPI